MMINSLNNEQFISQDKMNRFHSENITVPKSRVLRDVEVSVLIPNFEINERFSFAAGLKFSDFQHILQPYNENCNLNDAIFTIDRGDVSYELVENATMKYHLTVEDLVQSDCICVRLLLDIVKGRSSLESLASLVQCNKNKMYKVTEQIGRSFEFWRAVRGDGNCYYRAIYFSIVEQIIIKGNMLPSSNYANKTRVEQPCFPRQAFMIFYDAFSQLRLHRDEWVNHILCHISIYWITVLSLLLLC